MANQWNGIIATQTVAFRGTSSVDVKLNRVEWQNVRSIAGAAYSLQVTGGVSGTFGVRVIGFVGGTTQLIAGLTAITAAGTFIIYPVGYTSTGLPAAVGPQVPLDGVITLHNIVPPARVLFDSAPSTAGISANCTVGACIAAWK